MSAQILAERSLIKLTERLNQNVIEVLDLRYQPALSAQSGGQTIGVLPPFMAEQIGLRAAELNAYRRGMQDAADILREQLQALIAPDVDDKAPAIANGNGAAPRIEPVY